MDFAISTFLIVLLGTLAILRARRSGKTQSMNLYANPVIGDDRILIYQGRATQEGQYLVDEQLSTGRAISVDFCYPNDAVYATQYLPSYCRGGGTACKGCRCINVVRSS